MGTRHGGWRPRECRPGVCALLCCAVVVGSAVSFTSAHASSPFRLPILALVGEPILSCARDSLSHSFLLSLLSRLLLSAAWESVTMRHAASASALLAVAAACLLFRVILAREGGGTFNGVVRVDTGIGREGVRIRVCVYVRRCPSRCSSRPPCIRTRLFSNRQFALLQLPPPKLEVVRGLPSHVYYCSKLLDHLRAPPFWLTYSNLIGLSYSGVSVNVCVAFICFFCLATAFCFSVNLCKVTR